VKRDESPHSAYDLSAMVEATRHLLQTILAVTRPLAALASSAVIGRQMTDSNDLLANALWLV
jgi:hypothetical protein